MNDEDYEGYKQHEEECWHIALVSINETECQCMDCLRKWPKEKNFISDWPLMYRGTDV
jgi:hypothetical protein